jgi:flavin-dependent dehydrogenase
MGPTTKDGPVCAREHGDRRRADDRFRLEDGARVAVIGGGPAGSFFTYFLLRFADEAQLDIHVDVYEQRDFTWAGPRGCNMCGGLVAGPLVDGLREAGITLPAAVIQNEIDSYSLRTSVDEVRVVAPDRRRPALAAYRGAGPRDVGRPGAQGLDAFLLALVQGHGANLVRSRVTTVAWVEGRPEISVGDASTPYDLVVVAVGVNLAGGRLLEDLGLGAARPVTARVFATELRSEPQTPPEKTMEIILPDVAGIDAVGVIPKGEFSTLCLLGPNVDRSAVEAVFASPLMRPYESMMTTPTGGACHCSPRLNMREAPVPFADRVVLVGDCGVTRLYKDGLGSAFRTARAAAHTAVRSGVSASDFRRDYWPAYRAIARDNRYGKMVFALLQRVGRSPHLLRASLRVIQAEQRTTGGPRRANGVLWDLFTGAGSYRSILLRLGDPRVALRVGGQLAREGREPFAPPSPETVPRRSVHERTPGVSPGRRAGRWCSVNGEETHMPIVQRPHGALRDERSVP